MNELEAGWRAAWRDLALPLPPDAVFAALCSHWAEPARHYHTPQHLGECLALFAQVRGLARHPGEVAIALWFHDAIYELTAHDNEARSAAWSREVLVNAGARDEVADRVHALVLATCHREMPATPDERLLVDIDLAILGADPARFDEYEGQIRQEYAFVDEGMFRRKRREILQSFLERPVLYQTPLLRERLEPVARANLRRAIESIA